MNEPQTIFTFFFAVYFSIASTVTGKLHPFDTPSMWERQPRAWLRFFVSVMILDIFPLAYFLFVFDQLRSVEGFQLTFKSLLLLFFLGLSGLGFYRIYYGLMLLKSKGKYIFYDSLLYPKCKGLPASFYEDLEKRPATHLKIWAHLGPGLIWVFAPAIALLFL